ncbi:hypothetical protein SO802_030481 [Lithocarpus litseifolius]|uniref:Uncharacterized protein n=1 Tax=Lithocarpus litseifolius TaxID=425828 RepID=A0AAW2BN89_9ROSI
MFRNPSNPPQANPDLVAILPADELFFDGKLVPLQLSSVKLERANPPENRKVHPPEIENHWPIVNSSARPDQVQGGDMVADFRDGQRLAQKDKSFAKPRIGKQGCV